MANKNMPLEAVPWPSGSICRSWHGFFNRYERKRTTMPKKGGQTKKKAPVAPPVIDRPQCPPDCRGCGPRCPQAAIWRGVMAERMSIETTEKHIVDWRFC